MLDSNLKVVVTLLLLCIVSIQQGCNDPISCTQKYCTDEFHLYIYQLPEQEIKPGQYSIHTSCNNDSVIEDRSIIVALDSDGNLVTDSFAQIKNNQLHINLAQYCQTDAYGKPESVDVEIFSSGESLGYETFVPHYTERWCNGEECDYRPNFSATDLILTISNPIE